MRIVRKPYVFILLLISISFVFSSCEKEDPDAIAERDRDDILEYIRENDLEDVAIEHESGLFYVMENPGSGAHPSMSSLIKMRYTGFLLEDGEVFDAADGAFIQLGNTIRGWQIGIPLFKNGGKGILMVPSALGYGQYPPYGGSIPRNASLVFEFEIIDIASQ